ncbi:glycosyltransferase family 2 protein [Pedobacter panaciterrae]
MASVVKPLFSIAIPTYNRCIFLDNCLKCIIEQIHGKDYPIELIVSDNCSTDNTPEVVQKYIEMGLPIKYIRNDRNKGADINIFQCFTEASGKYVLILGDDEFFINGAIDKIMAILRKETDIGIIYIKGRSYTKEYKVNGPIRNDGKYSLYTDKLEFVKRIHYNFTFISGNIFRKELFHGTIKELFYNSHLLQLSWIFDVLINSANNIVVEDELLGIGSIDNTGGYKLYDVFVKNFNEIMNSLEVNGFSKSFIEVINRNLLWSFLPQQIVRDRARNPDFFSKESPKRLLHEFYSKYAIYWTAIFPLINLPDTIYKYWMYLLILPNKVQALFLKLNFRKNIYLGKIILKNI